MAVQVCTSWSGGTIPGTSHLPQWEGSWGPSRSMACQAVLFQVCCFQADTGYETSTYGVMYRNEEKIFCLLNFILKKRTVKSYILCS